MKSLFLCHSVPELIDKISAGEIGPVDLVDEVEKRFCEDEPTTHAWVNVDFQRARELALLDQRGGLRSLPFGIKDVFNTKDFPTEMGSAHWKGFTPGNNARVVDSLFGAGAIPVGKTVTAEFAVHALNETLNPHGVEFTPGTSSSGSAAAVASGMVPFALGTQTAGSIVRPASFCGVWGMKPSFGMIPRTGVLKTTDSLDTIGFLCAHGKSLRPILDAIRVKGPNYPFVYRNVDLIGEKPKQKGEKWRIGFVKTHVWDAAESYARTSLEELVDRISVNPAFEVDEVIWPEELRNSHDIHALIYAKSLSYYFQQEVEAGTEISAMMATMIEDGRRITGRDYADALESQQALCRVADAAFEKYDLIVSLGTSSAAPRRDEMEIPDPSLIWTLCHLPSVAVPTSHSPLGMPFGVQFASRKWNDYRLLQGIEAMIDQGILPSGSLEFRA